MIRIDPELGPVKTCNVCLEEWPLDDEFWYFVVMPVGQVVRSRGRTYTRRTEARHVYSRCRACWNERSRQKWAEKKVAPACTERYNDRVGSSDESNRLTNDTRASATTGGAGVVSTIEVVAR